MHVMQLCMYLRMYVSMSVTVYVCAQTTADLGPGRVGARILPRVPERARRLYRQFLGHRRLVCIHNMLEGIACMHVRNVLQ